MNAIQDDTIQIKAHVQDVARCQFVVDRPVSASGGALQFGNAREAKKHPLAEMIFGIGGVTGVLLSGNVVTVVKDGDDHWRDLAGQIGKATRAYLKSGALTRAENPPDPLPAISEDAPLEAQIRARVQHVLDTEINPGVAAHSGRISLIAVKGTTLYIQMSGGCQGCGMAAATLKQGVEKAIRQAVPEVTEVLDATDHAAGHDPYYSAGK